MPKQKPKSRKHAVVYLLPTLDLGNASVEFEAKDAQGRRLGHLYVSRGGIKLVSKHGRERRTRKLDWTWLFGNE